MKKLYLVDGMSLVFRAYHAMQRSQLKSPDGEPTAAVFGFVNIITSLLEKEKPENIAVVFDTQAPTFRHVRYDQYKAHRDAFPEDLVPQLLRIKEFLDYVSVPRVELNGYEADDVIGTLSCHAAKEKMEVVCLTSDKDFYQLVNEYVKLYKPSKVSNEDFEIIDINGVKEKFGVTPAQVIDVLALTGDASDNVPGVKGIGEKTAIPLIQKFGSLENLYEHLDQVEKETVRSKLEKDRELAFLSKELVTIACEAPVEINVAQCVRSEPKYAELDKFFGLLGFAQMRKKWRAKAGITAIADDVPDFPPADAETAAVPEHGVLNEADINYTLVNNRQLFIEVLAGLEKTSLLSVDLETDSLDKRSCNIVGIALSDKENTGYYIPVFGDSDIVTAGEKAAAADDNARQQDSLFNFEAAAEVKKPVHEIMAETDGKYLPTEWIIKNLKKILEDKKIGKCGQNIKFDAFILKRYGVNVTPIVFDSMVASYILNPDDQHNMDALAKKWLHYSPIPITSLIGEKKSKQISMREVDPALISNYACEDADVALKLRNILYSELEKEGLLKLAETVEFPLIEVLVDMESCGVAIDTESLKFISGEITREAEKLKGSIYEEAGIEFNIDSPKQLGHVLFEKLRLPIVGKTKTGYSTDVQVLSQLAEIYPIANMILEYRQLVKLKSTYVDALPRLIDPKTGRIHTSFNQTVTTTGRLSSTEPNIQNIPIRTGLGKEIRKAFVPLNKNNVVLSADYSQVELRIMAYICGDKQLVEGFRQGLDIHAATASVLFDKPLDKVSSDMRRVAKTVNFGIMYGLGSFGLSQRLGLGRRESQEIIDNYFKKYPGIKKYIDMTIKDAREKGYAESLMGRRRYFGNINSQNRTLRNADERAAINMPIQATAADMMKVAMIRVHNQMKKKKMSSIMMIQVHDELVFEVVPEELETLKALVKKEMESAIDLGEVPVVADLGVGLNWFEAH